jgi:prepilin-type N-terminal cleavage/methylation domain-containing protein
MWNNKGFSLVEALVSMAILSIAITLSMNFMSDQTKTRDQRGKQSVQRYIAIQVTQHINSNWRFYPPIIAGNPSDKIVHIGCLTKEGQLTDDFTFKLIPNFNETIQTGICPEEKTHYEVRFFWINPQQDEVKINLLTKYPGSSGSMSVRNFKIFAK